MIARRILSDLDGRLDPATIKDDETCIVFENATRVALVKLLGGMSRDAYLGKGLNYQEVHALEGIYYMLQT